MGSLREKLEGKKVIVRGILFTIHFDDMLVAIEGAYGRVNYVAQTITLEGHLEDQVIMAYLWHEIVEIIDHQEELNLKHHKIQTLGFALRQIVQDNREILI
jgi:hypothetical protein